MNAPSRPHRFAVVFLAWGPVAIGEISRFLEQSRPFCDHDLVLITDKDTQYEAVAEAFHTIVRAEFEWEGLLRKCELTDHLPEGYDAFCFLDTDTVLLGDIALGFEKAMRHGIALSPAPHYSLDHFWGFDAILKAESVPCHGQLQYNAGVVFFSLQHPGAVAVFRRWKELVARYHREYSNDQPFFTLAMEQEDFNPYTLSIGYNYRGWGDPISGVVRIWHSHDNPPKALNVFDSPWPRRRAWPDRVGF